MKRLLSFGVLVLVLAALSGCGKKQETEELQPITMESLSTVGSTTQAAPDIKAQAPEAKISTTSVVTPAKEALPLPPQGPYKPTGIEIQTALKNAGYFQGSVDGKMGRKTRLAVKEFQKANNLHPDGRVGKNTWEVLKGYLEKKYK